MRSAPRRRPGPRIASVGLGSGLRRSTSKLKLHHVRTLRRSRTIEARHRLVLDDRRLGHAEAVELGAHRTAISAEHPDLDIIARTGVARKLERPGHPVQIVAGRAVEAELHRAHLRLLFADQPYRVAPADMGRVEQSAIGTVVDVELIATALLHADEHARIFGTQRAPRLTP